MQGLADAIELGSYVTELYDGSALQWVSAANPRDGFEQERAAHWFHRAVARALD